MPDESCRLCGGPLCACSQCFQCKEPIKYICLVCGQQTPEQFHGACFYGIEKFQTQGPLVPRRCIP